MGSDKKDKEINMIAGWKELFRPHILERGFDYFESGAVDYLEKTEKGYRATVAGTDDYQVEIEVRDDRVYDMFCDCPYAEAGNYCKHMAAVLYEIAKEKEASLSPPNWQKQMAESRKELEAVVNKIPEEELKRLLVSLAWEDKSLRNRILTSYSETIDARQLMRLKREVDEIGYENSDRHGFVDYYHISDYANALISFLNENVQVLINKACFMQAFELTNYVFHCVGNQDMDDSEGEREWIAGTCYDFWKQLLDKCGQEEKNQMFWWFQKHQDGFVIDYMEDYISDFLMNEFCDRDMLKKKLEVLDDLIERADGRTDCGMMYSMRHGYENNIIERLQIMNKLGCTKQEIKEYREKHRRFSAIRKLEIEDYLNHKQYEKAIEVLKESKALDKEYAGLVSEYSRRLIEIYAKTGQKTEYRSELEYQVFTCTQNDLVYINQLKETCGQEEWPKWREKILEAKTIWSVKFEFLESEGLYERLFLEIRDHGSVYVLDQYEKTLKGKYPEAVRDTYIAYVMQQAARASDRKNYRGLMGYLKKIKIYPEGRSRASKIAAEWRVAYKNRPAMMDELKKAGF